MLSDVREIVDNMCVTCVSYYNITHHNTVLLHFATTSDPFY